MCCFLSKLFSNLELNLFMLSNLFFYFWSLLCSRLQFSAVFSQNILIGIYFSIIRLWSLYFSMKLVFLLSVLQSDFLKHFTLIKRYAGIFWMTVHEHYKALLPFILILTIIKRTKVQFFEFTLFFFLLLLSSYHILIPFISCKDKYRVQSYKGCME